MPISLYGVLDLSRVMFATLLGVIVMHEVLSRYQVVGLLFVSTGLLMLKYRPHRNRVAPDLHPEAEERGQSVGMLYVVMAFASCMLNALSGLLDKILMKDISSTQLQFWYMLFLVLFYLVYILVSRTKMQLRSVMRNKWVWMLSFLFVNTPRHSSRIRIKSVNTGRPDYADSRRENRPAPS